MVRWQNKIGKMKRGLMLVIVLGMFVAGVFAGVSYAQGDETEQEQGQEVQEVSSFDLFWPVVAGKTKDSPVYFLKSLKEKVRGALIFGNPQKADYYCFLATKRLVEGEALVEKGRADLGEEMFGEVVKDLEKARRKIEVARQKGEDLGGNRGNIVKQVTNIETFTLWYRAEGKMSEGVSGEIISGVGAVRDAI
jgi:hypothetical protein